MAKVQQETTYNMKLAANGKRRVTVREFKENILIDIREFYNDDTGESKPGKKVTYPVSRLDPCLIANTILAGHLLKSRPVQYTCHRTPTPRSRTRRKESTGCKT
jgi:hypothetical protein